MVALSDANLPERLAPTMRDAVPREDAPLAEEPQVAGMLRMANAVTMVRDSVDSGRLRLDPEEAERLLTALREQQDAVDLAVRRLHSLARPVPLGTNPVASAMEGKFWSRAAVDGEPVGTDAEPPPTDRSLTKMLGKYRQTLAEAETAVREAVQAYRTLDDDNATRFRRLASDEGAS
ncbi:hypothetical protein [Actinophytocola sediminis]